MLMPGGKDQTSSAFELRASSSINIAAAGMEHEPCQNFWHKTSRCSSDARSFSSSSGCTNDADEAENNACCPLTRTGSALTAPKQCHACPSSLADDGHPWGKRWLDQHLNKTCMHDAIPLDPSRLVTSRYLTEGLTLCWHLKQPSFTSVHDTG